ncbi:MAG TPA: TIGR03619 family F420-dependent LLM class oxidoreductase, partial [Candidatus Binatia bacterium]
MKFGVKLPNSGPFATPEDLTALARECDRLSYDSLWVTDHTHWTADLAKYHFPTGALEAWRDPMEPNYYEPLVTLSYLAGITRQITLGTSIVVLPTHNPVILAKQAACLDRLAGGRFILGVGLGGRGYAPAELGAVGLSHLLGKRGRVADEWIDVIRCIWGQPMCSYAGEFIKIEGAEVYPKPLQRPGPPIWIGGWGEAALKRAVRHGDGLFQSHALPEGIRQCRRSLDRLAAQSGRDPRDLSIASEHWLSIATDTATASSR